MTPMFRLALSLTPVPRHVSYILLPHANVWMRCIACKNFIIIVMDTIVLSVRYYFIVELIHRHIFYFS